MGREKVLLGAAGEKAAAHFLQCNRYTIIARNVRTPFGEIDIIAKKKAVMVFVEVKTRASASLGPPSLSVTPIKRQHLIKNALWYLGRRRATDTAWHIDVVSIMLDDMHRVQSVELIENAVTADGYDYRSSV